MRDEKHDLQSTHRPWTDWSLARWERYLADQVEALKHAKERGDVTDVLESCIHLAEHQIRRRICVSQSGRLRVQVIRDIHDLDGVT